MISNALYRDGPIILCDNNKSDMFNFSYGYLAAHLIKNNENVKIMQIDKDIVKNLMKEKPLIVGFGSIYPDLLVIKNIIAELNKANKKFDKGETPGGGESQWARKMSVDELHNVRGEIVEYIKGMEMKGVRDPEAYKGAMEKMEVVEQAIAEKR